MYSKGVCIGSNLTNNNSSFLWKILVNLIPEFLSQISWSVSNDQSIHIFKDNWILDLLPLHHYSLNIGDNFKSSHMG